MPDITVNLNLFPVEVNLDDSSSKDEPYDYRFVKWLIKEKVDVDHKTFTSLK